MTIMNMVGKGSAIQLEESTLNLVNPVFEFHKSTGLNRTAYNLDGTSKTGSLFSNATISVLDIGEPYNTVAHSSLRRNIEYVAPTGAYSSSNTWRTYDNISYMFGLDNLSKLSEAFGQTYDISGNENWKENVSSVLPDGTWVLKADIAYLYWKTSDFTSSLDQPLKLDYWSQISPDNPSLNAEMTQAGMPPLTFTITKENGVVISMKVMVGESQYVSASSMVLRTGTISTSIYYSIYYPIVDITKI